MTLTSLAVFVGPKGLLRYTQPHSASIPDGSITTGFVANTGNNLFNKFYTYWLCNTEADTEAYQLWLEYRDDQGSIKQNGATGKNTCTRVNLLAKDVNSTASAWEY